MEIFPLTLKELDPPLMTQNPTAAKTYNYALTKKVEAMVYIPGADAELHTLDGAELVTYAFVANAKLLLRNPPNGDASILRKYCSAFQSSAMASFFGKDLRKAVTVTNVRLAMELVLLYGLDAQDMYNMTHYLVGISGTADDVVPDIDGILNLPSKKDVARWIDLIWDLDRKATISPRTLKGQEYPSLGDFIHAFRAMGADPYEGIVAFANHDRNWMLQCRKNQMFPMAYSTTPVQFVVNKQTTADTAAANTVEDEDAAPPCDERKPMLGALIESALAPVNAACKCFLPHNIYTLRDESLTHKHSCDIDFTEMFVESEPNNTDIFNYLCRVSRAYGCPMSELFFGNLKPEGRYKPVSAYSLYEYSIQSICAVLGLPAETTDDALFDAIAVAIKKDPLVIDKFNSKAAQRNSIPSPASVSDTSSEYAAAVAEEVYDKENAESKEAYSPVEVMVKLRVCNPCDADSWENDNPNKNEPGFYWTTADTTLVDKLIVSIAALGNALSPVAIKEKIAEIVPVAYKAQVTVKGDGFKGSFDLY